MAPVFSPGHSRQSTYKLLSVIPRVSFVMQIEFFWVRILGLLVAVVVHLLSLLLRFLLLRNLHLVRRRFKPTSRMCQYFVHLCCCPCCVVRRPCSTIRSSPLFYTEYRLLISLYDSLGLTSSSCGSSCSSAPTTPSSCGSTFTLL